MADASVPTRSRMAPAQTPNLNMAAAPDRRRSPQRMTLILVHALSLSRCDGPPHSSPGATFGLSNGDPASVPRRQSSRPNRKNGLPRRERLSPRSSSRKLRPSLRELSLSARSESPSDELRRLLLDCDEVAYRSRSPLSLSYRSRSRA